MDGKALFFSAEGHGEALALRAVEELRRGAPDAAFAFADRLCRLSRPAARDFLLRAEISRRAGFNAEARADLARAFDLDPTDRLVMRHALTWGPEPMQAAAARAALDDPLTEPELLRLAIAASFAQGAAALLSLTRIGGRLQGWAAWSGEDAPVLRIDGAHCQSERPLAAQAGFFLVEPGRGAAPLDFQDELVERLSLWRDGALLAAWAPPAASGATGSSPPVAETAELHILVPVYEDFDASRACLEAAMAQIGDDARLVVVDDASPNAALRAWLDVQAEAGRLRLIRNPTNLGFAASVNLGLATCAGGDVLLLNADALPPPGAFARLAALSRAEPRLGTLTPLSNNGETCSFPMANASSALPSPEAIAAIDALARQANGDLLIDIPNGIGFCLYITRACLDAVGPLPEIYGRGYYEDVEFCLRAHEKGFRNVCATGVYVGHVGSLSFGADKRRLVMRNLKLLKARFPEHEAEGAGFLAADSLRDARAAIERLMPPPEGFELVVGVEGVSAFAARELAANRERVAIGLYDPLRRRFSLRGPEGQPPQSLSFEIGAPNGVKNLGDWLNRGRPRRVALVFSPDYPADLVDLLLSLAPESELIVADLDWLAPPRRQGPVCERPQGEDACPGCAQGLSGDLAESLRAWRAPLRHDPLLRPRDRMTDHVVSRIFANARRAEFSPRIPTVPGAGGGMVLGLLAPAPDAACDSLIVTLARALRRQDDPARLVVFGACLDDLAVMAPGNVFIAGRIENNQYDRALRQYEITELMSCSRTRFFGLLDDLADAFGLARAGFDWSSGSQPFAEADLRLDPRLCDVKIARQVGSWLRRRRAGENGQP